MKNRFREIFAFTDRERNGTLVLVALIVLVLVFMALQEHFVSLPEEDFTSFDQFVASLDAKKSSDSLLAENENDASPFPTIAEQAGQHSVYHVKELFTFNPNNLPENDWVRLGLSPAQARAVKKFEAKGGKFETKEDVKKLFVISAERYRELEPYIALPEKIQQQKKSPDPSEIGNRKVVMPRVIELNTADSSDLLTINGIGPVFARRIITYRERLGGFRTTDQLLEVFGIDAGKLDAMRTFLKTDSTYIRKINVNTAEVSELKNHPYISPNVAAALVNFRKSHGPFRSVADIRGCYLVSADLYRKIAPYLTI